jgi:hypothetical protein
VDAADAWIDQHFRFIAPKEDDNVTLEWLLERAHAAVIREDCDVMLIDPWNAIDMKCPRT